MTSHSPSSPSSRSFPPTTPPGNGCNNFRASVPLRLNDDRVTDPDGVVVPVGIVGAEVDAAVADIRIALRSDRPRRAMHINAAPGDPNRVVDGEFVTLRVAQRDTDGAGVHDHHLLL